jgi:hypothetical protein
MLYRSGKILPRSKNLVMGSFGEASFRMIVTSKLLLKRRDVLVQPNLQWPYLIRSYLLMPESLICRWEYRENDLYLNSFCTPCFLKLKHKAGMN